MRKLLSTLLYCMLSLMTCTRPPRSLPVLTIHNKTLIPEGIAVHPVTGKIYLSSLHQDKIVVTDSLGHTTDLIRPGQDGYMWGLGMKFSGNGKTLWSCSADGNGRTALFAIDVDKRTVIRQYTHDSARFLNDLVVLNDRRIFITDTEQGAVFMLQNGELQLWLKDEQLKWANGIAVNDDNKYLFVASGRYGLQRIEIATRMITSATQDKRTDYAIDGLVYYNHKLYAAIGWPQHQVQDHRILRYHMDEALNFIRADTLMINDSHLTCPTTLAVHKGTLYALGNTNLGIYNRHGQKLEKVMDSLSNPMVVLFDLKK